MTSKMRSPSEGGSRIGIVFNGSPLFTGQAGGESNIRQWVIENDWLEAIIALPDQLFYNTGISTYIWALNNNKSTERKGTIQLINATDNKDEELIASGERDFHRFWEKIPRSLGNKRKQIPEEGEDKGIAFMTQLYGDFEENEFVKILSNDFFGYHRITVEQPLKDEESKAIVTRGKPLKQIPKRETMKADILALEASSLELEKKVLD